MAGVTPPGGPTPAEPTGEGMPDLKGALLNALIRVREDLGQSNADLTKTANDIKNLATCARRAQQAGE